MAMTKIVGAGALLALSLASAAQAAQGCGIGFHRGPYGGCRPNYGPGPYVRPVIGGPVIGVYYPGRGYWYGGRYWRNRYRYGPGWRYR